MRTDVPEEDREFGLLCWFTDFNGFRGSVKERPEDFIVEEILKDGTVLSLENPKLQPSGYEGLFTHFVLIKKGIGNFEAVWLLSQALKVPAGFFFYSGNKDKDALTVQRMAVFGVPPEKLETLELPDNLEIRSPIRELRRIFIGEHKGNRFRVTIRDVPRKDMEVARIAIEELSKFPYLPNFFGYQRFGLARPISHYIGKLLLFRKYKEALIAFLAAPALTDGDVIREAKDAVLTGDYAKALKLYPRREFVFEYIALKTFVSTLDPIRALKRLPSFLLRMFVEAYQAFIFNRLLSELLIEGIPLVRDGKPIRLPILGVAAKAKGEEVKAIFQRILADEGINLKMLKNEDFPPLTFRGTSRKAVISPIYHETKLIDVGLYLSFSLEKGAYATVIIRELMKEYTIRGLLSRIFKNYPERVEINRKRLEAFLKEIKSILEG